MFWSQTLIFILSATGSVGSLLFFPTLITNERPRARDIVHTAAERGADSADQRKDQPVHRDAPPEFWHGHALYCFCQQWKHARGAGQTISGSMLILQRQCRPVWSCLGKPHLCTIVAKASHAVFFLSYKSWSFIWRQQLAYKNLAANYGLEQIVNTSHPRARKAVKQIYLEGLDQYMQWFPWSWFSTMQFIGAGGFSAVYAALMSPPYDVEPVKVSLKVVDDKILNEV